VRRLALLLLRGLLVVVLRRRLLLLLLWCLLVLVVLVVLVVLLGLPWFLLLHLLLDLLDLLLRRLPVPSPTAPDRLLLLVSAPISALPSPAPLADSTLTLRGSLLDPRTTAWRAAALSLRRLFELSLLLRIRIHSLPSLPVARRRAVWRISC
jgi:hypothetical protein